MEDCNFYVNQNERIIVCVLEGTQYMFLNYVSNKLNFSYIFTDDTFFKKLNMPNRFVGIARCAEDDTWNEEFGRKIAYLRLREKVYHSFFNRAKLYIDTLDGILEKDVQTINLFGEKIEHELESRNNYIAETLSKNA